MVEMGGRIRRVLVSVYGGERGRGIEVGFWDWV